MPTLRPIILVALLAICLPIPTNADTGAAGKTAPLFVGNDALDVTIEAPFTRIMRERSTEEDLPAILTFKDVDGGTVSLEIGVRNRGKYRQQRRICPFAPLRLNFRKSGVKDTLFATVDKIKLVTHCRSGRDSYQQAVLREYLAYRILNIITDYSYRVRLLRIQYVDTQDGDTNPDNFGFLIEHRDQLADRIGVAIRDLESVRVADLESANTNLGSLFQYLIGNTDFSPTAGAEENLAVITTRYSGKRLGRFLQFHTTSTCQAGSMRHMPRPIRSCQYEASDSVFIAVVVRTTHNSPPAYVRFRTSDRRDSGWSQNRNISSHRSRSN